METGGINFFAEALLNKDFFTTLIVLGILFLGILPLFYYINKKQIESIKQLSKMLNNTMDSGFSRISQGMGKSVIENPRVLVSMGEKVMSSATLPKINFLKRRLIQNDIHSNQTEIKNHIRTNLNNIAENTYIDFLNNFNTPVGIMGDWVKQNFPMDRFLDEVYKVFFSKEFNLDRKIELIESIILDFHSELWAKFKNNLY